tara:strand:- start:145 stop:1869 length:1725 start_codon:yes stop_codon:yes gene_type:complete
MDEYLEEQDREKFFGFATSLWEWYKILDEKNFTFHNINLLSIIDRNELHEFLMSLIPKITAIKKILAQIDFTKIYASFEIYQLLKNNTNYDVTLFEDQKNNSPLTYDEIILSSDNIPFSIMPKISRTKFRMIKKNQEKITSKMFHLRKNIPEKKKIVLIEFNPEVYEDLLYEMQKKKIQPILINFRRPATWSLKSINILRKTDSLVILAEDFLGKHALTQIEKEKKLMFPKIENTLKNESLKLSSVFIYEGIKFHNILIDLFIKILRDRLEEYLIQILVSEKLDKFDNVIGAITLNFSGETEKSFSKVIKKFPVTLLQHAFSNYTKSLMFLDVLDDFRFFKDKIAVYGHTLQEYLLSINSIPEDKIIVCGSPKYDSFKPIIRKNHRKKTILVTLRPIISHVEGTRLELYKRYETAINSIIKSCDDLPNNEIIFKLHPQQNYNNQFLKDVIKEKDSSVKIIQSTSIKKLLIDCDLHINLAPDNFDISSVVLEAMILKRPTLNIQLQSTPFEFGIIKENAIRTIMYNSDIKQEISDLIFNKEKINQLLKKSAVYLDKYISNQGNASKILLDELIRN